MVPLFLDAMTTTLLFRDDAYLATATARVTGLSERGIELDRTIFYPQGGGQQGDPVRAGHGAYLHLGEPPTGRFPADAGRGFGEPARGVNTDPPDARRPVGRQP